MNILRISSLLLTCILIACTPVAKKELNKDSQSNALSSNPANAFPSTYTLRKHAPVLIKHATILTGTGEQIDDANLLFIDGKITHLNFSEKSVTIPDNTRVIDAKGKWLTPGIIDVHSHLGVYPAPGAKAHSDGNEVTSPNTAEVWAEHSVWPQDPQFPLSLAGGVTSQLILPGSANLFGGRGVTLKNVPALTVQAMKFPGAPHALKMACGENPSRVYGSKGRSPATDMGNVAGYRKAWIKAVDYKKKLEKGTAKRDLQMETLVGVLDGDIYVHNHCYKADQMAAMIDISKEFGYQISAFHHAIEAYKISDMLANENICAALWSDWWGFKLEALDAIRENVALVDAVKNGCAIVHSDSPVGIQRLNQEAAKSMKAGNRLGFNIDEAHAIKWITSNPAKAMGILDKTGTLQVGKMADIVLWSGNPFSIYTKTEKVFIDGYLYYDRLDDTRQPATDFSLDIVENNDLSIK